MPTQFHNLDNYRRRIIGHHGIHGALNSSAEFEDAYHCSSRRATHIVVNERAKLGGFHSFVGAPKKWFARRRFSSRG